MPDGWDLYHNHERIEEKTEREQRRQAATEKQGQNDTDDNLVLY